MTTEASKRKDRGGFALPVIVSLLILGAIGFFWLQSTADTDQEIAQNDSGTSPSNNSENPANNGKPQEENPEQTIAVQGQPSTPPKSEPVTPPHTSARIDRDNSPPSSSGVDPDPLTPHASAVNKAKGDAPPAPTESKSDPVKVAGEDETKASAADSKPAETSPVEPTSPAESSKHAPLHRIPGFAQRMETYRTLVSQQLDAIAENYSSGIDSRLDRAADSGDLALASAWRREQQRVNELRSTLAAPASLTYETTFPKLPELGDGEPESLIEMRRAWIVETDRIGRDLLGKLDQSLKVLESDLTKAREIDDAEAVSAFRRDLPLAAEVAPSRIPPKGTTSKLDHFSRKLSAATKQQPFVNSLGMQFVPVPITGGPSDGKIVLFSIWETRVRDYEAFMRRERDRVWNDAPFPQGEDHPAVNTSWHDAVAFCEWLTDWERRKGTIGDQQQYRLPTDHEWSCAVGIGDREDGNAPPVEKTVLVIHDFPWGGQWPPPKGAGNLYGEETVKNPWFNTRTPIQGFNDGYDRTAPVGTFIANQFGLYDLAGNVME